MIRIFRQYVSKMGIMPSFGLGIALLGVLVRLSCVGSAAVIELSDSGHGMSPEFVRDHLFQPFASTKPAGMDIGLFECREYIRDWVGNWRRLRMAGVGFLAAGMNSCD